MKTGTLLVNTERGISCQLIYNRDKYRLKHRLFPNNINIANLNRVTVEFEVERGKVVQVIHNGLEIYNIPKAQAPYNFIPLNTNEQFVCSVNLVYSRELVMLYLHSMMQRIFKLPCKKQATVDD